MENRQDYLKGEKDHSEEKIKLDSNLEERRQYQLEVMGVVNQLLDTVSPQQLCTAAECLDVSHYLDVVEERCLSGICGYPTCSKPIAQVKQQYHLSTKSNKVFDISQRKKFCSSVCFKASQYYQSQLPSSSWARKIEEKPTSIRLLNAEESSGSCGLEVDLSTDVEKTLRELLILDKNEDEQLEDCTSNRQKAEVHFGDGHHGNKEDDELRDGFDDGSEINELVDWLKDEQESGNHISENQPETRSENLDNQKETEAKIPENQQQTERLASVKVSYKDDKETKLLKKVRDLGTVSTNSKPRKLILLDELPDSSVKLGHGKTKDEKQYGNMSMDSDLRNLTEGLTQVKSWLHEWITSETRNFLRINDQAKLARESITELNPDQLNDKGLLVNEEENRRLKDGEPFVSKVEDFFHGKMKTTASEEVDGATLKTPARPTVDSQDQMAIRRKIVLEKVSKVLHNIPDVWSQRSQSRSRSESMSDLKSLICTFNLSSGNIIFKPIQWKIVVLCLLEMLLKAGLTKQSDSNAFPQLMEDILKPLGRSHDFLNAMVTEILHEKS